MDLHPGDVILIEVQFHQSTERKSGRQLLFWIQVMRTSLLRRSRHGRALLNST
jgi:hypothetical protein